MTSRTLPKLSGVAIALLLALGAAGCSEDPKPKHAAAHPTPTASPTPDEPEKPEAPEMPDAAKAHTKAGAKAFAAYFVETFSYANQTLNTVPFQIIADDRCEGCNGAIASSRKWRLKGGVPQGGKAIPRRIDVVANSEIKGMWVAIVNLSMKVDRSIIRSPKGKMLLRTDAGVLRLQAVLNWKQSNGWQIASLVIKK